MKRSFTIPALLAAFGSALLLSACSDKVLDFRNAEISNGKIYKAGGNEPFTGKVTNIPAKSLLSSRKGFMGVTNAIAFAGAASQFESLDAMCDAEVNNGWLDGNMICNKKNSDAPMFELSWKNGTLDGAFKYYGLRGGKNPISTATFHNDLPDGDQIILSAKNQKPIHTFPWKNGVLNGQETTYDETSGVTTSSANYVDSKLDGDVIRYAPDGKQVIYKIAFTAGEKNGPEDSYSPSGKHLLHGQWVNDYRQGLFQQWDEQGNLVAQKTFKNNIEVTASAATVATSATSAQDCVQGWTTAFHKEKGDDAIVSADQLDEWASWCKQGKRPG